MQVHNPIVSVCHRKAPNQVAKSTVNNFRLSVSLRMCSAWKLSSVFNRAHNVFQNQLKNLESRSEVMVLGIPCRRTTSRKKRFAVFTALCVLWQWIKCAILVKRSTTTKAESLPHCVRGNPSTKSMEISSQGVLGTSKGMYKPVFCACPFPFWHIRQRQIKSSTSLLRDFQKYRCSTSSMVLSLPKCPESPLLCNSLIRCSRIEPLGIHNRVPLKRKPSWIRKSEVLCCPEVHFSHMSWNSGSSP